MAVEGLDTSSDSHIAPSLQHVTETDPTSQTDSVTQYPGTVVTSNCIINPSSSDSQQTVEREESKSETLEISIGSVDANQESGKHWNPWYPNRMFKFVNSLGCVVF